MRIPLRLTLAAVLSLTSALLTAQTAPANVCAVTPISSQRDQSNLFSPAQEVDLGDILANTLRQSSFELDEPGLSAYLQRIGDGLVSKLPPLDLKFRFYLSNMPQANAFSIAGGRVYVTRKLVGFLRSEDELAAVMSHELGHIVTHQSAIDFSRRLRAAGIQEVKDRNDIEDKFHHLLETRSHSNVNEQVHQVEADRVGLEVLTFAGYDPKAMADSYDRLTNNKGRVGNWFTDLFGSIDPDTKRFREMQKELERIPKSCIQQRQPGSESAFKQWQRQVIEYSGTGRQEQVPGLLSKQAIEPPMQDQIHTLRFSYDGKYLLAQDDASIYVLTRDPLQLKFRIDAPSAYPAQYSLDSKFVTFYTPDLRVEVWDLETGQRTQAFEIVWRYGCMQTALSADGRTLACIDARNALELFDTGSGDEIFEQKEIRQNSSDIFVGMGNARFSFKVMFLPMAFTPDGKYFLVSRKSGNYAIDVQARQQIPLGGAARVYMPAGFTFMSDGRLAGNPGNGVATISTFPQGVVQREVDMGSAAPFRVAKGELLLLRPIKDYAVGVLDLASNQIVRANKTAALDIYGDLSASMMGSGEVALFGASTTPLAKLALPHGHFGNLQALALSRDQSWLTVSSRSGASVWNLHASTRLYNLKSYRGACFSDDGNLYVDFPKQAKLDHSIVRLSLQQPSMTLAQKVEARHSWQRCQYLMSLRAENEPPEEAEDDSEGNRDFRYEGRARSWRDLIEGRRENETLEVRNTFTGALLWSRKFGKSVPAIFTEAENGLMAFRWRLTADGAKAEAKAMSAIGKNMSSTHDDDYLVELLDLETGKPLNAFTVDSNNGTILLGSNMTFNKDWLAAEDFHGRTLVYSLKTGLRTGQFFGKPVIVGRDGATLLVRQGEGHLALYDLNDVHEIKQMTFSYPVSWTGFTHGGNTFALTADQQLYLIDSTPSDSSRAFR